MKTATNSFIIRSIKAYLPSFADQFMQTVPLTRIRDIAHRNDIPKDLKNEIKHSLQNKLHRCADPGDLKTCERLMDRIRPDHSLSGDFKHQMEIFYGELKEFFNAVNLDKLLETAIWGKNGNEIDKNLLNHFLSLKRDANTDTMTFLTVATHVREHIQDVVPRLFAHDENKKPIYQGLSLADIQIE